MKALYLPLTKQVYHFTEERLSASQLTFFLGTGIFKASEKQTKSLPSATPSTKTKNYYTEEHFFNSEDICIGTMREGKYEVLEKLTNPFHESDPANQPITPKQKQSANPDTTGIESATPSKARSIHKKASVQSRTPKSSVNPTARPGKGNPNNLQRLQKKTQPRSKSGRGRNGK